MVALCRFLHRHPRPSHTREAYLRAVDHFLAWREGRGVRALRAIRPIMAASYIERRPGAPPTVKQHLSAIRQCFDWLVSGGVFDGNPAALVCGPKHMVKKGKTPVLDAQQICALLDAIHVHAIADLRDRALIGAVVYSFAPRQRRFP